MLWFIARSQGLLQRLQGRLFTLHLHELSTNKKVASPTLINPELKPEVFKNSRWEHDRLKDPRWELVVRITQSPAFVRTEQLSKLLSHVSRMAILERFDEISEQQIGVAIFGRSPDYDSSADSIVRSHATRLRQRLEQYFRGEGRQEPLRIEIPRGGYLPRFYTLESPPLEAIHSVLDPSDIDPVVPDVFESFAGVAIEDATSTSSMAGRAPNSRRNVIFAVVATLMVVALALIVRWHLRRDAQLAERSAGIGQTSIERRFWQTLFPSAGQTMIVSGDSGLTLFETLTNHEVSLEDYINGTYRTPEYFKGLHSEVPASVAIDIASRRYTSFVDEEITQTLTHLPEWTPSHVTSVYAQDLKPQDAAASNLILVGSRETNPWISLVEPPLNFVLTPDGQRGFQFLNRHPLEGEQKIYGFRKDPNDYGEGDVYADVAYLPNPGGKGHVLALSGMWISSTQAAGRFVFDSPRFSAWLQSIANPDGTIPPFELLLDTKSLQGNATGASIVAKRVMSGDLSQRK